MPAADALLTVTEMYRADAHAVAAGIPGTLLMARAGRRLAQEIRRRWRPRPTVVLCGPGNNGGDGFVAARLLEAAGWSVRVALLGSREALKGDAADAAARWAGPVEPLGPAALEGAALAVDAIFGAGLGRPLEGAARATVEALAASGIPVAAVDVPSGVHGDSGQVLGAAAPAALTVTFFRRKPGHLLEPGRGLCGETVVVDIGIPETALGEIGPAAFVNGPGLWRISPPGPGDHKYTRGHVLVVGGGRITGAGRLVARAAARAGAGLVTVLAPAAALRIYAGSLVNALVRPLAELDRMLADGRVRAVVVGPGNGAGPETAERALAALSAGKRTVLDADALTALAPRREAFLRAARDAPCVLTPHDGEFARLFRAEGDRLARARAAAAECGAVVVLKGSDTVIAAPDGRAAINANAPPWLATGGTGDVLAGLVGGLLGQGLPPFEAAAAGVWLQGAAAAACGPGLVAEDLPERIPGVLATLFRGDPPA